MKIGGTDKIDMRRVVKCSLFFGSTCVIDVRNGEEQQTMNNPILLALEM